MKESSQPTVVVRVPPVFADHGPYKGLISGMIRLTGCTPEVLLFRARPDGQIENRLLRKFEADCRRYQKLRRQAKIKGRPGWKRGKT